MITGKIRQVETMGLHDGPGVRIIIFMQGCYLRCLYCHNPEMLSFDGGTTYTPEEIIKLILKYKSYFGSNGGVTFSGGEPLAQPAFLLECLKLCKKEGIHTCLDTAGVGNIEFYEEILKYVDLVIYDIKALEEDKYQYITKSSIFKTRVFLELCQKLNKDLWIRSVIVPGINDNEEYIDGLIAYIKPLQHIKRVELLGYHTLGLSKYEELKIDYPLKDIKDMDKDKLLALQSKIDNVLQPQP